MDPKDLRDGCGLVRLTAEKKSQCVDDPTAAKPLIDQASDPSAHRNESIMTDPAEIGACAVLDDIGKTLLRGAATTRSLRWAEHILADLEAFEAWAHFRERAAKHGYANDAKEIQGALIHPPCEAMTKSIVERGLVDAYFTAIELTPCTCGATPAEEIVSILFNPTNVRRIHGEIFCQPDLPPAWASALEQSGPPELGGPEKHPPHH